MKNFLIVFLFSASVLSFNWNWPDFSIQKDISAPIGIHSVWTVDTVKEGLLRAQTVNNSSPLITKNLIVQGNAVNGIKAYTKDKGNLVWSFKIPSGTASSLVLHKDQIYFGGADGFFYSLQLKTGRLNWKFFTGSENSGTPLVYKNHVYWTASNQKLYALTLKGKRIWFYSGPSLSGSFSVRGRPGLVAYKNWIYAGFSQGHLIVLNRKTGQLKWKKTLSDSHPIVESLKRDGKCLFVPVFDFYLFCLNPFNGKVRWKARGGFSSNLNEKSVIYQFYKGQLYALNKSSSSIIWRKKMDLGLAPLPVSVFKNYLIYGFPSQGDLTVANKRNGNILFKYRFGRGLAVPLSIDVKNSSIYLFSVDGYLHKLSFRSSKL